MVAIRVSLAQCFMCDHCWKNETLGETDGGEARVVLYDPGTEIRSLQWGSLKSPKPKEARKPISEVRNVLICFSS